MTDMPTADANPPDDPEPRPRDPLTLTDEEWIAASQACCGLDPVDPGDPPTAAPPPGTP